VLGPDPKEVGPAADAAYRELLKEPIVIDACPAWND
jgi:hypothetical protein